MTEKSNERREIEVFEDFLARHGSDRTRWPASDRLAFASLLALNPEAKRLFREAEMLDRLLDLAPAAGSDLSRLTDRIVAAADAEAGDQDGREPRLWPVASREVRPVMASEPRWRTEWPAAAFLAASLVLGTMGGLSGAFNNALAPIMTSTTTAAADAILDPSQIALGNDGTTAFEEDML
ncbi:MAG: hypothetical protein WC807_13635 [Hyphomicrobium sp.]